MVHFAIVAPRVLCAPVLRSTLHLPLHSLIRFAVEGEDSADADVVGPAGDVEAKSFDTTMRRRSVDEAGEGAAGPLAQLGKAMVAEVAASGVGGVLASSSDGSVDAPRVDVPPLTVPPLPVQGMGTPYHSPVKPSR